MPNVTHNNSTSTGCLGGQKAAGTASILESVMAGFTYAPGTYQRDRAQTQQDRQEYLKARLDVLLADVEEVCSLLDEYRTEYGPYAHGGQAAEVLQAIISRIEATDRENTGAEVARIIEQDDAWAMRCWYGNEAADYQ